MKTFVTRLFVVIVSYLLASLCAAYVGALYSSIFPLATDGSFIGDPDALNWILGMPLAILFFLPFFMAAVARNAWLWIIVPILPPILLEMIASISHIYVPIILAVIGLGLGMTINMLLAKYYPSLLSRFS